MRVHLYEKAFLWLGALMSLVFGVTLIVTSVAMGIHLPGCHAMIDPAEVRTIPPFDRPGVRQTGERSTRS